MLGPDLRLAFYQPDIPGNLGSALRLGACLDVAIEVIEPCGFPIDDRRLRRAGMDYAPRTSLRRHADLAGFVAVCRAEARRLVLLSARAARSHAAFRFAARDVLLLGQESAGVPAAVEAVADHAVAIPMRSGMRSLNVVVAAGIALGEALRQTGAWAELERDPSRDPLCSP